MSHNSVSLLIKVEKRNVPDQNLHLALCSHMGFLSRDLFLFSFLFKICFVCAGVVCVEVRGQLVSISFLLLPCGPRDHRAWQQSPLPNEPPCQHKRLLFKAEYPRLRLNSNYRKRNQPIKQAQGKRTTFLLLPICQLDYREICTNKAQTLLAFLPKRTFFQ